VCTVTSLLLELPFGECSCILRLEQVEAVIGDTGDGDDLRVWWGMLNVGNGLPFEFDRAALAYASIFPSAKPIQLSGVGPRWVASFSSGEERRRMRRSSRSYNGSRRRLYFS
jgi:hypothetical protein